MGLARAVELAKACPLGCASIRTFANVAGSCRLPLMRPRTMSLLLGASALLLALLSGACRPATPTRPQPNPGGAPRLSPVASPRENPASVDLREPMLLGAHAIVRRLDPAQDHRPWFLIRGQGGVPAVPEHASWDLGDMTGRYLERQQPVQFSHKHHVGDDGIDCRYCHATVETTATASMPPTQTCMNCHSQLWNDSPYLEPVRASFRENKPIRLCPAYNGRMARWGMQNGKEFC